jgi:putative transposase
MARPLRIQYPGAVYHVTVRGNERKEIFRGDEDRQNFLKILSISLRIYYVKFSAYVLMENHFHLLVETPMGNLGEFMRHFNISYTGWFNRKHKRTGHLYQGRYKSILVDKDEYLSVVSRYIHLNPVRTKKMRTRTTEDRMEYLKGYQWSSLPGYIGSKKDDFIDYDLVLSEFGGNNRQGRREYQKAILLDIAEGLDIKDNVIGQSILGEADFVHWVKETFLKGKQDRESSGFREIKRYRAEEEIIRAIEKETDMSFEKVLNSRGILRHVAMDILYRIGGLKGIEIGDIFGVDYSTVSQSRKRLREKLGKDKRLNGLINRIESELS